MSILIKDINIPSSCSDCPLNYDMMSCIITGTRWWSDRIMLMDFDCDKERLYDCPLIEVPTTHGRLGDLDKLKEQIKISCEDACMGNSWKQGMMYACGLIDTIPTIIKERGNKMNIELKNCPCCGDKAKIYKSALLFNCEAKVMCPTCRLQTATYKEPIMENAIWFAVNAWNRRVAE